MQVRVLRAGFRSLDKAIAVARAAEMRGLKNGVV
jgi:hypothetical protein